jgi:hypothetical protein
MGLLTAVLLSALTSQQQAYSQTPQKFGGTITLDEPSELNKQIVNEAIRKLQTLNSGSGNPTEALEQTPTIVIYGISGRMTI